MIVYYSDYVQIPLPEPHQFPGDKYRRLRYELLRRKILTEEELHKAPIVDRELIQLAHTPDYFDAFINGSLNPKEIRELGIPWSEQLVLRTLAGIGGVNCAAIASLEHGIAGSLSGGTHHAFPGKGRGFCVFNDSAIAITNLMNRRLIQRAAIIDLDAHQGDGNSKILGENENVFILSMHNKDNYPLRKIPSSIDIGLPADAGDEMYNHCLKEALPHIINFSPDIVFYIAGVDPLITDRLGKLNLTKNGLFERDKTVLEMCSRENIPIVLTMGGGYSRPIELTIDAHVQTYAIAKSIFKQ